MQSPNRRLLLAVVSGLAAMMAPPAFADDDPEHALERLASSSLEELMQVRVFGVTGTPLSRQATPAAVYVITGEDLRRSGHRTLAEALRMVPGMYVGKLNSSSWLVGARGLSGSALTATRYLVLVDGRTVYDPLLSTTNWDTVDTLLEDVDRIEVIRGPGATIWGANAMNGVINIVTRRAADTQGWLLQAGVGNRDRAEAAVRYGGTPDDASSYRVWAKGARHGESRFVGTGAGLVDDWASVRAGLRYDRSTDERTLVSVFADAYDHPQASESVLLPVPGQNNQFERSTLDADVRGASLMLRINRGFGEPSGWRIRAFADQTRRAGTRFAVSRQTADLDLRSWRTAGRHEWVWGGEAIWTSDKVDGSSAVSFTPAMRSWYQLNAFVQDTVTLVEGRWYGMAGTKLTWHDFVGTQLQPSLRTWWTPSPRHTVWASLSRPVRVPSRFEEDGALVLAYADLGGQNVPLQVTGAPTCAPSSCWPGSWATGCNRPTAGWWRWRRSTTTTRG